MREMIDDLLILVLSHLDIRQLFRLERVSKQFERYVNEVLKTNPGIISKACQL